jgi:hypothetical protein
MKALTVALAVVGIVFSTLAGAESSSQEQKSTKQGQNQNNRCSLERCIARGTTGRNDSNQKFDRPTAEAWCRAHNNGC